METADPAPRVVTRPGEGGVEVRMGAVGDPSLGAAQLIACQHAFARVVMAEMSDPAWASDSANAPRAGRRSSPGR